MIQTRSDQREPMDFGKDSQEQCQRSAGQKETASVRGRTGAGSLGRIYRGGPGSTSLNLQPDSRSHGAPVTPAGFCRRGGGTDRPSNQRSGWKSGLGERMLCPAMRNSSSIPWTPERMILIRNKARRPAARSSEKQCERNGRQIER